MKLIGLTGSIGAGKSEASKILARCGAYVIDADEVSRDAVKPGTAGAQSIRRVFGEVFFHNNGELDRKKLAELVFNDEKALKSLNRILHPLVLSGMKRLAQERSEKGAGLAVWDVPLLIEEKWNAYVDETWLVTAPDAQRLKRILQRDKCSEEQALRRMQSQAPQAVKEKYADVIILNDGSLEELEDRVIMAYKKAVGV